MSNHQDTAEALEIAVESDSTQAEPPVSREESVPDAAKKRRSRRNYHLLFLSMAVAVYVLSIVMEIGDDQDRVFFGSSGIPLPGTCTWKKLTGTGCPGCGMTRAFISFGHGDLMAGWRYNPAALLAFGFLLVQFPYRVAQLWRIRTGRPELDVARVGLWCGWIMGIAVIGQWLVRMVMHFLGAGW